MSDLPIEWFLRDDVQNEIHSKGKAIARLAIKLGIDYVNDWDSFSDCIDAVMPLDSLTAEELAYAVEFSQVICSYESMVDKGLLTCTGDGYALTEKGRQRRQQLLAKR